MKRCPQCNRVEADTLAFCRVDGSPLEETSSEVKTSLLPHAVTDPRHARSTGPTTDPRFDILRDDPRFAELLKKVGLREGNA